MKSEPIPESKNEPFAERSELYCKVLDEWTRARSAGGRDGAARRGRRAEILYLAIADRLAKSDPGNAGWQRDLSVSNERLGDIFLAQGNLPAALEQYRASLDRMVPIRDRDSSNADLLRFTLVTLNKIGGVQQAQGDLAGALKSYQDSLAIRDRLAKSDPGNVGWQRDLSVLWQTRISASGIRRQCKGA